MNYSARNKSIFSILVLLTIFTACTQSFGYGEGILEAEKFMNAMDERDDARYNNRPDLSKMEAKRAGNEKRFRDQMGVLKTLNDAYSKMAETLNANRIPAKAQVESNKDALKVLKAALTRMDKKSPLFKNSLTKYHILKAWNEYFSDDLKTAQKEAQRATKLSPGLKDARVTETSLFLIVGEKPVPVSQMRTQPKNTNTYPGYNLPSQNASLLELDVDSLNTKLTDPRKPSKISAMELNCLNSTTFKYTPGSEALCVIFWRLSDKDAASVAPSDPNDPSAPTTRPAIAPTHMPAAAQPRHYDGFGPGYEMQPNMNPYSSGTTQKQKGTFLTNTKAFKELFSAAFGTDNVKFLAVNIDSPAAKRKVAEKIMENSWPWAHVMTHDPKSGENQFMEVLVKHGVLVKHDKPIVLIMSNDGTIKYAGPAEGFLAPMMFSKVAGKKINPAAAVATAPHPSNGKTGVASAIFGMFRKPRPGSTKTVATGTNTNTASKRVTPQPKEMDVIDEVQASRLLESARTFMKLGRKAITPRKGIEFCRDLLAKYPNTKYSEEARVLLRGLSERDRKRYKVTDEECGL